MTDENQVASDHGHRRASQPDPFERLKDFLLNKMRMSHIYQPAMLKRLLEGNGTATVREIAETFLARDLSQIEYYEQVTKHMPGPVLARHGLVVREGDRDRLAVDAAQLSDSQKAELIRICDEKLTAYEVKRGREIWLHRLAGLGEIPGSLRFEVLKRAGSRCELCGIPATERALDVDHIHPRKYGGTNVIENLQALCWKCNQNKRASDATDFRSWSGMYLARNPECPFCNKITERIVIEDSLAYVVRDAYP